jgi:hypothetical protein
MAASGYDRAKYFQRYPELATITADLTTDNIFASNKLHNNIIYYPGNATADLYWAIYLPSAPGNVFNDNLIWNNLGASSLRVYDPKASLHGGVGSRYSWDQWKALGFDTRSVIADPLFVDPSKDNYALQANSPALGMGFQPIDQSKIGIEQSSNVVVDDSTSGSSFNSGSSSNGAKSNTSKSGKKISANTTTSSSGAAIQGSGAQSTATLDSTQDVQFKWYEKLRDWIVNLWSGIADWFSGIWVKLFR